MYLVMSIYLQFCFCCDQASRFFVIKQKDFDILEHLVCFLKVLACRIQRNSMLKWNDFCLKSSFLSYSSLKLTILFQHGLTNLVVTPIAIIIITINNNYEQNINAHMRVIFGVIEEHV